MDVITNFGSFAAIFAAVVAVVYGVLDFFTRRHRKSEIINSFTQTVGQLASNNAETQLSAAILLRRFLNLKQWMQPFLYEETINVISSLLRTLPTGIYQKTLGDGLAYAKKKGLDGMDLQKTNLQNLYLGNKTFRLQFNRTDFYMADLSYALLDNIQGHDIIFYDAILMCASIKNCDFTNGDLRNADLTNAVFKNVILMNTNFQGATNMPQGIKEVLDEDGKVTTTEPITARPLVKKATIFFSMPGVMTKDEEVITKVYKDILEKHGYDVIYYNKDDYPKYGQLNKVRKSIMQSAGVIAFGFKQISVVNGVYRPHTDKEEALQNTWLSTPWSELEVGMALMQGLPILLVHDKEVNTGVFDNVLSEYFIGDILSDYDTRKIATNKAFDAWIKKF